MPNGKTIVRTNNTPGSVKEVPLRSVTFAELWANYPSGDPYDNPAYDNQCAIRMSVMLHRVGIGMKSFSERLVRPASGEKLGRILLDGKPTATRADELAQWLELQPFAGLPRAEDITGADWEKRVKGRTGIIEFSRYWARDGESTANASGGHIDLWNGSRLTISSGEGLLGVIGRRVGIASAHIPWTNVGYSDLGKAKAILFWEIK
ncbi:type VI secretion system amidase effector protein Tae4 [Caballeronia sp. BCC1704]|uniref:type VI secretion system amidase effector protein Tae4 n=1 Tax=Caballeronia sp. BCC1704 TaxID=2676300 RepID=UPI0015898A56|nr:type VI secretion system amidase effector protein Tae4 [Caballeronia sp. BCC1704]